MTGYVTGWKLDGADRPALRDRFPTAYARVVADHVTLDGDAAPDAPRPRSTTASIIGVADDGKGVQALVVAINGSERRPDGGTFHITWSLAEGRRAVESNAVIAEHGWTPVDPQPAHLIGARWPD